MASYILQEDNTSKILLEDGSGAAPILSSIPMSLNPNYDITNATTVVGNGFTWESAGTINSICVNDGSAAGKIEFLLPTFVGVYGNDQSSSARGLGFKAQYEI